MNANNVHEQRLVKRMSWVSGEERRAPGHECELCGI